MLHHGGYDALAIHAVQIAANSPARRCAKDSIQKAWERSLGRNAEVPEAMPHVVCSFLDESECTQPAVVYSAV